jgi:hypothetical protein
MNAMIIVQNTAPATIPGLLRTTFNCKADEATPLFMGVDVVYVYMQKGETRVIDLPDSITLTQGAEIPLHEIAAAYADQHKDFGLAWTKEELPDPAVLRANPAVPYLKI